ncbi:MAG: hypothetical protein L0K86_29000, partial [Actinomycetia bacterium]|nr:hypothetical protein [Actinomycetes bacterium]
VIDSTRGARSDLGGFGVPIGEFVGDLHGLAGRRQEADPCWSRVLERDAVARSARSGVTARLPLTSPRSELEWDAEGSRVELLHPRYGVVPFQGRDMLLANLMLWRERPDAVSVVVLAGPGGFGKTRTAIEACAAAGGAGWAAGLLAGSEMAPFRGLDVLGGWPGRLFVVVDYAETRPPGAVAQLLHCLRRRSAQVPARVVLVMRQGGTREQLRELIATGDERLELERVVRAAEIVRLDRDVPEIDRMELFRSATEAFAVRLRRAARSTAPDLAADHFARPLYVLAAALLCASDTEIDVAALAADDILGAVLDRHEAEYWDRWNTRLGAGLSREQQRRAVALVALLGADTEQDALTGVGMVPGVARASAPRREEVVEWLMRLYGGQHVGPPLVRPLEPDLLAEVLVARELSADGLA